MASIRLTRNFACTQFWAVWERSSEHFRARSRLPVASAAVPPCGSRRWQRRPVAASLRGQEGTGPFPAVMEQYPLDRRPHPQAKSQGQRAGLCLGVLMHLLDPIGF